MEKLVALMISETQKYPNARFKIEVTPEGYNLLTRNLSQGKYTTKAITPEELFTFIGQWLALS